MLFFMVVLGSHDCTRKIADKAWMGAFNRLFRCPVAGVSRYRFVMSPAVKTILERVASWPTEDQEELAEIARDIEARRTGVYRLSDGERAAIRAARRGPLASDDEVEAFWKRRGLA
jgi:hypothetical protein